MATTYRIIDEDDNLVEDQLVGLTQIEAENALYRQISLGNDDVYIGDDPVITKDKEDIPSNWH
jgi:hypothetical protein